MTHCARLGNRDTLTTWAILLVILLSACALAYRWGGSLDGQLLARKACPRVPFTIYKPEHAQHRMPLQRTVGPRTASAVRSGQLVFGLCLAVMFLCPWSV